LATASLLGAGLLAGVFMMTPLAVQLEAMALQASDTAHYIEVVNPEALP
jgi:hypothetical protein